MEPIMMIIMNVAHCVRVKENDSHSRGGSKEQHFVLFMCLSAAASPSEGWTLCITLTSMLLFGATVQCHLTVQTDIDVSQRNNNR